MRLKALELEIEWPKELPVLRLHSFLINNLLKYGEPLRWAITKVKSSNNPHCFRELTLEAVIIIS